jgi:hypothetical protein
MDLSPRSAPATVRGRLAANAWVIARGGRDPRDDAGLDGVPGNGAGDPRGDLVAVARAVTDLDDGRGAARAMARQQLDGRAAELVDLTARTRDR